MRPTLPSSIAPSPPSRPPTGDGRTPRGRWRALLLLAAGLAAFSCVPRGDSAGDAGGEEPAAWLRPHAETWERMVAAEDARARTPESLEILVAATGSEEPLLRALGVRALGRLERSAEIPRIAPLLSDPSARVRAAAALALARAAYHDGAGAARAHLREALAGEAEPAVAGALVESLGRLRHESPEVARETAALLAQRLEEGPVVQLHAIRALYFLARQAEGRPAFAQGAVVPDPVDALRRRALAGETSADMLRARRIRSLSVATLVEAGRADADLLAAALRDPDALVRREAAVGLQRLEDEDALRRLAAAALEDASGVVRVEAVRAHGARLVPGPGCEALRRAAGDRDEHAALAALDLLGARCAAEATEADIARLDSIAGTLPADAGGRAGGGGMTAGSGSGAGGGGATAGGGGATAGGETGTGSGGATGRGGTRGDAGSAVGWHRSAHALVALGRLAPDRLPARLPAFVQHPDAFVRMYAARAAAEAGERATLEALARDPHPNVRTESVRGLHALAGDGGSAVYIAQLAEDDSQLLQAAAAALEGSAAAEAAHRLLDALDRVSALRSETSRDARRALLVRAGELGGSALAERVRPYLRDFDPEIARLAAGVLEAWTGTPGQPAPVAPPALALPGFGEAERLSNARFVMEMAEGGEIELRLFPFDAPTNAARFARLARDGYYDGLTLHRVVPNFVVQGGSPHANEYRGHGPFTRDELGRPNWRGSVGLSTRGRDTGDAQLYVNLVDNVRLDTDYTIFAEVVRGMEVVDRLQEGALIRRIREVGP